MRLSPLVGVRGVIWLNGFRLSNDFFQLADKKFARIELSLKINQWWSRGWETRFDPPKKGFAPGQPACAPNIPRGGDFGLTFCRSASKRWGFSSQSRWDINQQEL
jgi:hypothetical protein